MIAQPRNLYAVVLLCVTSAAGFAQPAPGATNHPKIGLVLEGGGALGLAHIGVIQWLGNITFP